MKAKQFTVGTVASLAGITVRTLHHYDQIGLLRPSERSESDYRQYNATDLQRLARILFYRELGFALDQIAKLLDNGSDKGENINHLRQQHALVLSRIDRFTHMALAIEKAMEAQAMGISLSPEERLEIFGDFNPDQYTDEAAQRWGQSDAYRQSARRTARYSKQDWARIMQEAQAVVLRMASVMESGLPADSREAMEVAEAHRQQITDAFYDCSYEIHVGLASAYVNDPRFTATYEKVAPGLARYLAAAIQANAAR